MKPSKDEQILFWEDIGQRVDDGFKLRRLRKKKNGDYPDGIWFAARYKTGIELILGSRAESYVVQSAVKNDTPAHELKDITDGFVANPLIRCLHPDLKLPTNSELREAYFERENAEKVVAYINSFKEQTKN